MKIRFDPTGLSISLGDSFADEQPPRVASDQTRPKDFYVYGHYDSNGSLFYVGRGTGRRAWSLDRHPLWTRYVQKNLGGKFEVKILADGLTEDDADEYEAHLMSRGGNSLVNWANMGRSSDYKLILQRNAQQDANRRLIQETKTLEKTDPEAAIKNYKDAIGRVAEYAFVDSEHGLVGQLLKDECEELGYRGEPLALERLTMCLLKLGRVTEAAEMSAAYFSRYRRDQETQIAIRANARIQKALNRANVARQEHS